MLEESKQTFSEISKSLQDGRPDKTAVVKGATQAATVCVSPEGVLSEALDLVRYEGRLGEGGGTLLPQRVLNGGVPIWFDATAHTSSPIYLLCRGLLYLSPYLFSKHRCAALGFVS